METQKNQPNGKEYKFTFLLHVMHVLCTNSSLSSIKSVKTNSLGNFELLRNGVILYKGAGAKDHFDLLVESGATNKSMEYKQRHF